MQLKTHPDTKGFSECKLRFHFLFESIIAKEREYLKDFDWDVSKAPSHRLYLSKDTTKLMEVVNNFIATIFYRVNIDDTGKSIRSTDQDKAKLFKKIEEDNGQQVKWKVDFRIKRFPKSLTQATSVPYLFSPNFKYQLEFLYRSRQFIIRETRTQYVYLYIRKDLIKTDLSYLKGEQAIKLIVSRFKWESESRIRIINESNMDCMFAICSTDPEDKNVNARYLKLISAVKIDNEFENIYQLSSPHMIDDAVCLETRNVLERLIRINQDYKVSTLHALNQKDHHYNLLSKIYRIDYLQEWGELGSSFDVQMSFTWLDWRIMELIAGETAFDVNSIDDE